MKENARQGFWNGARSPFGYEAVEAERRGVEGLQYGVKAIAAKLNAEGVTFRCKSFMLSNVHRILTGETYTGRHHFNVSDSKTGAIRPQAGWIAVEVPAIILRATWEGAGRNPARLTSW